MTQRVLTFILLTSLTTAFGQDNPAPIDSTLLDSAESTVLNNYFKEQRGTFDFAGKRISFVSGSAGTVFISKRAYFDDVERYGADNSRIATSLLVLTDSERSQSRGYDAIVTAWVKLLTEKRRKKIVEELGTGR